MIIIIDHFSDIFGGDRAFQWKQWSIEVEHFSGETKACCPK